MNKKEFFLLPHFNITVKMVKVYSESASSFAKMVKIFLVLSSGYFGLSILRNEKKYFINYLIL